MDLLINNAGVAWIPNRELSEDGFELTFATNHLGMCVKSGAYLDLSVGGRQISRGHHPTIQTTFPKKKKNYHKKFRRKSSCVKTQEAHHLRCILPLAYLRGEGDGPGRGVPLSWSGYPLSWKGPRTRDHMYPLATRKRTWNQ